ncbi:TorF family putative porin [Novosphingobium sp. MBES04]|uniref:TorF family putative porin n=1 Tax=Novosphingobium sp. MBES04 TaxID=1206458 RepID=UPI00069402BA|nr:TorF family putative porin [Novosphingobium sp. MBES04]
MVRTFSAAVLAASLFSLTTFAAPGQAYAQAMRTASAALEARTDMRSRGISDSEGELALQVDGSLPITSHIVVDANATTLRGARRHGGSELGIEIAPKYVTSSNGWDFSAGARGHVFIDAGELDYVEIEGSVSRTLGPAWLTLGASYAPSQYAIGGDNLYLSADIGAGIPGSPLALYAGIGQTIGSTNDAERAVRLRPDGDYTNWYVAVERSRLNFAIGMELSGTSIDQDAARDTRYWDRHTGTRLAGYMRVSF